MPSRSRRPRKPCCGASSVTRSSARPAQTRRSGFNRAAQRSTKPCSPRRLPRPWTSSYSTWPRQNSIGSHIEFGMQGTRLPLRLQKRFSFSPQAEGGPIPQNLQNSGTWHEHAASKEFQRISRNSGTCFINIGAKNKKKICRTLQILNSDQLFTGARGQHTFVPCANIAARSFC